MDRKTLGYSGLLLLFLVVASVLLNQGVVRGIHEAGEITVSLLPFATSTTSTLDQPRLVQLDLDLPDHEVTIDRIEFIVTTSTGTTTHWYLPLVITTTSATVPLSGQPSFATGTMDITVDYFDVFPSSTPASTLGSTLPGAPGLGYKGIGTGDPPPRIVYTIAWTPPNDNAFLGDHFVSFRVHFVGPTGGQIVTTSPIPIAIVEKGEETVFIPLVLGFNLITLPVDPGPLDSLQVMDEINTQGASPCAATISVQRCAIQAVEWQANNQAFVFNTVTFASGKFDVFPGKGFFINIRNVPLSGGWSVTGAPITSPVDLTFLLGFNLVGVPFAPELPISNRLGPSNAPSSTRAIVVSLTDAVNHPIKLTKPSLGVVS